MNKSVLKGVYIGMLVLLLSGQYVHALELEPTTLTLSDIAGATTLDSTCLNYCITGVCVWLRCSIYECDIETSIRVSHYNPDLIVSVYDEPVIILGRKHNPFMGSLEEQATDSVVGLFHDALVGGGHRVEGGNHNTDHSLRFKEATAIGHPFSSLTDFVADSGYYCPSEAESMEPFLSTGA